MKRLRRLGLFALVMVAPIEGRTDSIGHGCMPLPAANEQLISTQLARRFALELQLATPERTLVIDTTDLGRAGFAFWVDSASEHYQVWVDIVGAGWSVKKRLSFPYVLHRYQCCYRLETFMKVCPVAKHGMPLAKKYAATVNGRKKVQFFHSDPWAVIWPVPEAERIQREGEAKDKVVARMAADLLALVSH